MRILQLFSLISLSIALAACQPNHIAQSKDGGVETSGYNFVHKQQKHPEIDAKIAQFEQQYQARIGVAIYDMQMQQAFGYRPEERFAMCSTFKLPFAAMILDKAEQGDFALSDTLPITRDDILAYAPFAKKKLGDMDSALATIEELAYHMVILSDNSATNILINKIDGTGAFTQWMRGLGDVVTRLDRMEPELNENAQGDVRDTTNPTAMSNSIVHILQGDIINGKDKNMLWQWMQDNKTGDHRIRAGLPPHWQVGDKTGTCHNSWNDIAVFYNDKGTGYVMSIFVDRPNVKGRDADAIIANITKILVDELEL